MSVAISVCWDIFFLIWKVHKAWDGNDGYFSTLFSPFSTKPVAILEENRQVLLMFLPKTHVCMVVDWYYTI